MQFVVPQFIDVEAKIIGPISARQFIILLITFGVCFLWYELFSMIVFAPVLFFTASIGGALAFGKVNGQLMHFFLLNLAQTLKRPRLKVWKRLPYVAQKTSLIQTSTAVVQRKETTQSRLAAMSLMVDTGGAYISEESTSSKLRVPEQSVSEQPMHSIQDAHNVQLKR
ncbi:MAG TPA: PrgI family protein [Patescibacteria group bacterium]|nr:PrgI family protein [Patescibacteria group bacterium]